MAFLQYQIDRSISYGQPYGAIAALQRWQFSVCGGGHEGAELLGGRLSEKTG